MFGFGKLKFRGVDKSILSDEDIECSTFHSIIFQDLE